MPYINVNVKQTERFTHFLFLHVIPVFAFGETGMTQEIKKAAPKSRSRAYRVSH